MTYSTKINSTTLRTIEELFDEWGLEKTSKEKRPPTEVKFVDDPIALSWASYHVWQKFSVRRWVSLNEVEAHDWDREMAQQTRRYYRDKFTMQTLKGKELTKFQSALYGLVSGDKPVFSDQIGMLMKLPYFYVEDTTLDLVYDNTKPLDKHGDYKPMMGPGTLTPVTSYLRSRRGNETWCYWFQNQDGHPVMWAVSTQNSLRSLVESLWKKQQPLAVDAIWHVHNRAGDRDRYYYQIDRVELI